MYGNLAMVAPPFLIGLLIQTHTITLVSLLLLVLLISAAPVAADMTPAPPRTRMPPGPSAEQEYGRGLAATQAREWSVAVAAFNIVWDAWVPAGASPARACVEARLANPSIRVEIATIP